MRLGQGLEHAFACIWRPAVNIDSWTESKKEQDDGISPIRVVPTKACGLLKLAWNLGSQSYLTCKRDNIHAGL